MTNANLLKHFVIRHIGGASHYTQIHQCWEKTPTFFIVENQRLWTKSGKFFPGWNPKLSVGMLPYPPVKIYYFPVYIISKFRNRISLLMAFTINLVFFQVYDFYFQTLIMWLDFACNSGLFQFQNFCFSKPVSVQN